MRQTVQAIIINEKDNVGTALKGLSAGAEVSLEVEGRAQKIRLRSDIPMGHKFALKDMDVGDSVIKYGEAIGQATVKITCGEHVHGHNVTSQKLKENPGFGRAEISTKLYKCGHLRWQRHGGDCFAASQQERI